MIRFAATAFLFCASSAFAQVPPKDGDLPRPGAAPCAVVSGPIRFCGTAPAFVLTPQGTNDEITRYYETPEGVQAVAIVENLGIRDGLNVPRLQEIALETLAQASGTPADQLPVIERGPILIDGASHSNFVYRGTVDGVMYVYSNSLVLMQDAVAQFITIEADVTTYSPRHRSVHTRFLEQMQVTR